MLSKGLILGEIMIQKILIADNEVELLDAYAALLRRYGFKVFTTGNDSEFEKIFYRETPDLLIMDIVFGTHSGPEAYDRIMKSGSAPKTPVIFVSELVNRRAQSPLVKGRQVAMYAKPVDVEGLIQDIRIAFPNSVSSSRAA